MALVTSHLSKRALTAWGTAGFAYSPPSSKLLTLQFMGGEF